MVRILLSIFLALILSGQSLMHALSLPAERNAIRFSYPEIPLTIQQVETLQKYRKQLLSLNSRQADLALAWCNRPPRFYLTQQTPNRRTVLVRHPSLKGLILLTLEKNASAQLLTQVKKQNNQHTLRTMHTNIPASLATLIVPRSPEETVTAVQKFVTEITLNAALNENTVQSDLKLKSKSWTEAKQLIQTMLDQYLEQLDQAKIFSNTEKSFQFYRNLFSQNLEMLPLFDAIETRSKKSEKMTSADWEIIQLFVHKIRWKSPFSLDPNGQKELATLPKRVASKINSLTENPEQANTTFEYDQKTGVTSVTTPIKQRPIKIKVVFSSIDGTLVTWHHTKTSASYELVIGREFFTLQEQSESTINHAIAQILAHAESHQNGQDYLQTKKVVLNIAEENDAQKRAREDKTARNIGYTAIGLLTLTALGTTALWASSRFTEPQQNSTSMMIEPNGFWGSLTQNSLSLISTIGAAVMPILPNLFGRETRSSSAKSASEQFPPILQEPSLNPGNWSNLVASYAKIKELLPTPFPDGSVPAYPNSYFTLTGNQADLLSMATLARDWEMTKTLLVWAKSKTGSYLYPQYHNGIYGSLFDQTDHSMPELYGKFLMAAGTIIDLQEELDVPADVLQMAKDLISAFKLDLTPIQETGVGLTFNNKLSTSSEIGFLSAAMQFAGSKVNDQDLIGAGIFTQEWSKNNLIGPDGGFHSFGDSTPKKSLDNAIPTLGLNRTFFADLNQTAIMNGIMRFYRPDLDPPNISPSFQPAYYYPPERTYLSAMALGTWNKTLSAFITEGIDKFSGNNFYFYITYQQNRTVGYLPGALGARIWNAFVQSNFNPYAKAVIYIPTQSPTPAPTPAPTAAPTPAPTFEPPAIPWSTLAPANEPGASADEWRPIEITLIALLTLLSLGVLAYHRGHIVVRAVRSCYQRLHGYRRISEVPEERQDIQLNVLQSDSDSNSNLDIHPVVHTNRFQESQ